MTVAALVATNLATPPAHGQALTVLHAFKGARASDGANPSGPMIRDAAGNLYGLTDYGGDLTCNCGTVFKLDRTGQVTVLHSFTGSPDGSTPSGLISDSAGNLYGTTAYGGDAACNCGILFKLDPAGNETVLHTFGTGLDGQRPETLVRDAAGNFYGVTYAGGSSFTCLLKPCGTIYELAANGTESVLYSFTGGADGQYPVTITRDNAGNLYGTTVFGGNGCSTSQGCGTIFELDTAGKETILHRFRGGTDGSYPFATLIVDSKGNLYGAASGAGAYLYGTVFMLNFAHKFSVIYAFKGGADGSYPFGDLVRDATGNFFGTTTNGGIGNAGYGTVFKLSATGQHTLLHMFVHAEGAYPYGRLSLGAAGSLIGSTSSDGSFGNGTLFELTH